MDRFDELFIKKINQIELPDSEQAWNDFETFRRENAKLSQINSKTNKNILFLLLGFLLLFVGAIGGYFYAQLTFNNKYNFTKEDALHVLKNTNTSVVSSIHSLDNSSFAQVKSFSNFKSPPIEKGNFNSNGIQKVDRITLVSNSDSGNSNLISIVKEEEVNAQYSNYHENTPFDENYLNPISDIETFASNSVENKSQIISDKPQTSSSVNISDTNNQSIPVNALELNQNIPSQLENSKKINEIRYQTNVSNSQLPVTSMESGNFKKVKSLKMKEYVSLFKRYTDKSLYSLENSNDIGGLLYSRFIENPANSGIENRYSISTGVMSSGFQTKNNFYNIDNSVIYIGNSFTMLNNRIGAGFVVNKSTHSHDDALNVQFSSAYRLVLSKNQQLRMGVGFKSSTISFESDDFSNHDFSMYTFQVGVRYNFKTLFAQLSSSNIAPLYARKDRHVNIKIPQVTQLDIGGRFFMSQHWAMHPFLSIKYDSFTNSKLTVDIHTGISLKNRWMVGLYTQNFNSVGLYAGAYANKRLSLFVKSDLKPESTSTSRWRQTGEIMLKLELGSFKK